MDDTQARADRGTRRQRPGLVLAMLLGVYCLNFIDRQIVSILAAPIQAEFALTDRQLGALGGLAFALLYTTLGVPLAWLADRTRRTRVIAVSLAVWSGFTVLCGAAGGFGQLFACRVGVGIGEAGGVAPSYALIGEIFPPQRRARALAIYSLGIPIGSAAGVLLGGTIAALVSWRVAFAVVGAAGLILAPVFARVVREPLRAVVGGDGPATPGAAPARLGQVLTLLAARPSFWLLSFGAAAISVFGYGFAFWLPSLLRRSFALDLPAAGRFFAALVLAGGTAGVLAGGWLADRLSLRDQGAYARIPAIALLAATPLFVAGLLARSPAAAFWLLLVPQALAYTWFAPLLAGVQRLVPAAMRATAAASFLLINNLIGLGLGALSIGALSDRLAPRLGDESLRWAMISALCFYVAAALLLLRAARTLPRDCVQQDMVMAGGGRARSPAAAVP